MLNSRVDRMTTHAAVPTELRRRRMSLRPTDRRHQSASGRRMRAAAVKPDSALRVPRQQVWDYLIQATMALIMMATSVGTTVDVVQDACGEMRRTTGSLVSTTRDRMRRSTRDQLTAQAGALATRWASGTTVVRNVTTGEVYRGQRM